MILMSTSFSVPLDMDGGVWYIEESNINSETLTLAEEDNDES